MDIEQLTKTTQWLDDERRRDKKDIAAVSEKVTALEAENAALNRKIQALESALAASTATVQRLAKIDEILDGYRREMTRQLDEVEQRRAEAARDDERLRKVERDGLNKSLADLRKGLEGVTKLERETQARKEEENRIARVVAEMQKKVTDFNRYLDERVRSITVLEEGRRQDAKRITELQTELSELRKRTDENRGKIEVVEDLGRRLEVRLGELSAAEADRRAAQAQWVEAQAVAQAERDRAWADLRGRMDDALKGMEEYGHRVDQYAETHREVKRAAESYQQAVDLLERRIAEATEMQRLAEERFRQDWAAFMADDQKRWTTHMLLRDEQWREHDRTTAQQFERLDSLEEHMTEALDTLQHLRANDITRLQTLLGVLREMMAEYDQDLVKAR